MAIKIEISGFDKDFLPVFESLAKSLSQKPILSMFFFLFFEQKLTHTLFSFFVSLTSQKNLCLIKTWKYIIFSSCATFKTHISVNSLNYIFLK
ncbi:hypothetical protein [Campylobacter jejuni]|uniref:hypothetical protein n=1 Tax=Campylobacter jejuni TaxID=197 RepID=UPI00069AA493|nr:hypothetical protein [Campylobacter jejuni]